MITAQEFKKCNEKSPVVKAAWTVNGRPIKKEGPDKWNYMRVTLKSGEEFLLPSEIVKEIGGMDWVGGE